MELREQRKRFLDILHSDGETLYGPIKTRDGDWIEGESYTKDALLSRSPSFDECNYYVNVHRYYGEGRRTAGRCSALNGFFIDIDAHDDNASPAIVDELYNMLLEAILDRKILPPTMIIDSGRGLAVYYLYAEPVSTSDFDAVKRHNEMYEAMFFRFNQLFENKVKIDTAVRDASRVCRISGTYNTKADKYSNILRINESDGRPVRYTQDEIAEGNYLTEMLACEVKPETFGKKAVQRIVKKSQSKKAKEGILEQVENLSATRAGKIRRTMQNRLDWLEAWLKGRNYQISGLRELFLFVYYCTAKAVLCADDIVSGSQSFTGEPLIYDSWEAMNMLLTENGMLSEPLDESELYQSVIAPVDAHPLGIYWFTNERLINLLGITEEEAELYEIGKNMAEAEAREERKIRKIKARMDAIDMYRAGAKVNEIADKIDEYGRDTIKRTIAEYNRAEKDKKRMEVLRLYQQQKPIKEIAREMEMSSNTVREIVRGSKSVKTVYMEKEEGEGSHGFVSDEAESIYTVHYDQISNNVDEDEQDKALRTLQLGQNTLIQGNAGTGKTTLLKHYLDSLSPEDRLATLVVAPTGKAAMNLNAKTIHAAFSLSLDVQDPEEDFQIEDSLLGVRRLVIDEANLVRVDVMDAVLRRIQQIEMLQDCKIQIIAVGDFRQIAPAVSDGEWEYIQILYPEAQSAYCFESPRWKQTNFLKIMLKKIHRQNDQVFVTKLDRIAYGDMNAIEWFNYKANRYRDKDAIYICPTNHAVKVYNNMAIEAFPEEDCRVYTAIYTGPANKKETDYPCPSELKLAIGMKVMTICNAKDYVNGTVGIIKKLRERSIIIDTGEREIVVPVRIFILDDGSSYEQLPVCLAYAITVHKAEGLTFDRVNIIPGFFAKGQLYVALSRVRDITGLHLLDDLKAKDLRVDIDALRMTI